MKPTLSFSRLPSSFKRVNDVPLIPNDSFLFKDEKKTSFPSSTSSVPLSSNLDDYLSSSNGSKVLDLNKKIVPSYSHSSSANGSTGIPFSIPRIGARKDTPSSTKPKPETSCSQRLSAMIESVVEKKLTAKKIVESSKKKATPALSRTEEQQKKALKHTSIDLEEDTSADEEDFSSENEEDRAFIDDKADASENLEEESEEGSDGESESWEEIEGSEESDLEEEASIVMECLEEDDEDSDEGSSILPFSAEEEASLRQTIEERKYLSPIDMTYVPGLLEGGYGTNTLKNLTVMLLNSAMEDFYTYIQMPVPRVQAILTAMAEYNSRVPINKGSTEGTVMAYRLWLYTRERVRKAALQLYKNSPEMVEFLESLVSPSLMDSFFLVKKDFPVESCAITGNPTDVGFEIVSGLNQQEASTLWFDRNNEVVTDICLNLLRFWFLPFTLRSFAELHVKNFWTIDEDSSRHQIKMFFVKNMQSMVYTNAKTLIESFVSMMSFFELRVSENSELPYS